MLETVVTVPIPVIMPSGVSMDPALLVAVGGIIVALTGLLGAVGVFLEIIRRKGVVLDKKIDDVHTLVNSNSTAQSQEIGSLTRALQSAGVAIPLPVPPIPSNIPPSPSSVAEAATSG